MHPWNTKEWVTLIDDRFFVRIILDEPCLLQMWEMNVLEGLENLLDVLWWPASLSRSDVVCQRLEFDRMILMAEYVENGSTTGICERPKEYIERCALRRYVIRDGCEDIDILIGWMVGEFDSGISGILPNQSRGVQLRQMDVMDGGQCLLAFFVGHLLQ
ncbi:hypothetical protein GCM10009000_091030 [Halobacterium noricense]